MKKSEDNLRDTWENIIYASIPFIVVPEGERREKRTSNLIEIMAENFPNLGKEKSKSRKPKESK